MWPTWDDANYSYFAIQLAEKWHWDLLIGHEKTMPLFTWLQGLFFKGWEPSLYSMWLYPALLSILVLPLGQWASRKFLPPSLSFLYMLPLAFSFWPLYYGRFDAYLGVLQWVLEFLLLGILGLFLKSYPFHSPFQALLLGLTLGLCFYASMLFVIPALLLTLGLLYFCFKDSRRDWKTFLSFGNPALLVSLPMDIGFIQNLSSGHVFTYSILNHPGSSWLAQGITSLSYLTVPFMGSIDNSYWSFAPLWGGFLNPILGALFFTGLMYWRQFGKTPFFMGWTLVMAALLLPAFFFNTVEFFRIDLIMPLLLVPVALGLLGLLVCVPKKFHILALLLLLVPSLGIDCFHLLDRFHQWSSHLQPQTLIKSPEHYKAFQIMEPIQKENGPGLIFDDFQSDIYDQSLLTATYPFNAARNPRLKPEESTWASLLVDYPFQSALQSRFPSVRWILLKDPSPQDNEILLLALIPIKSSQDRQTLLSWIPIHRALQDLVWPDALCHEKPRFSPGPPSVVGTLWLHPGGSSLKSLDSGKNVRHSSSHR